MSMSVFAIQNGIVEIMYVGRKTYWESIKAGYGCSNVFNNNNYLIEVRHTYIVKNQKKKTNKDFEKNKSIE